ncbi:MAG: hypothetical protein OEZ57_12830 [Nitrospirota bacterium]|nr:hypothetical protein [Nitrospirota bacterium]
MIRLPDVKISINDQPFSHQSGFIQQACEKIAVDRAGFDLLSAGQSSLFKKIDTGINQPGPPIQILLKIG